MKTYFIKELSEIEADHWWLKSKTRLIGHYILKEIRSTKKKLKILDIGAGPGSVLGDLIGKASLTALDINKESLAIIKKKGVENLIQADFTQFNTFKRNFYDIVVASDIIEHIKDDLLALQKVNLMLKKKGVFIIHVPANQKLFSYWDTALGHYRRYDLDELIVLLKSTGYTIVTASYRITALSFLVNIYRSFKGQTMKRKKNIKSDFQDLSILNPLLYLYTLIEDFFIFKLGLKLPFGLSIFIIAQKK